MVARLHAVSFDVPDPELSAAFWAGLLRRDIVRDGDGVLLPGASGQVGLLFRPEDVPKAGPNRLHLHLTGDDVPFRDTVAAALELDATPVDLGNPADADFVVLADPAGNEFCVCEGGSSFLADCGFLGEVTCDGSRAVGVFWSAVLGWPLVWDQDEETAIQSPSGGTKISWGGEDAPADPGPGRQRFELIIAADELPGEVARLHALGATLADGGPADDGSQGIRRFNDPDGHAFTLSSG